MRSGRWLRALVAAFLCAACVHADQSDPLAEVWRNPLQMDGQMFETTIYPYDYAQDPERYVMCRRPCTMAEASDDPVVIVPLAPGSFDGTSGTEPYRVRVIFRAVCFRSNSACPHRSFIFQQVE